MLKILIGSLLIFSALCWWENGHMTTAQIAYNDIQQNAPNLIPILDELVAFMNPVLDWPVNFVSGADWADYIKTANLNILDNGHFFNMNYNPQGNQQPLSDMDLDFNNPNNIAVILEGLTTSLNEKNADLYTFNNCFQLLLLLHLWGDIHQPLHNADYFSNYMINGDRGGNLIYIKAAGNDATNLHGIWDDMGGVWPEVTMPVSSSGYSQISTIAKNITTTYPRSYFSSTLLNTIDPNKISVESYQIGCNLTYPEPIKDEYAINFKGDIQLSQSYLNEVIQTSHQRVALGGYRLSTLLQHIFKGYYTETLTEKKLKFLDKY